MNRLDPTDASSRKAINDAVDNSKGTHLMGTLIRHAKELIADESGGEVLEYALIVGLIVVAAIGMITSVGAKVLRKWTSLNNSM